VLVAIAYAALVQGAQPDGGATGAVNSAGQPIGPAVLTSPPSHGGKLVDAALSGVTGIAATVTAARGGDADDRLGSISLNTRRLGYAYDRGLVVRVSNAAEIGGNDRGVHGALSFEAAGGYRFHVSDNHGPFVRAGVDFRLSGDALVYQSQLEVPQLHAGYQYQRKDTLVELTSRAGFVEDGRSNTGHDATRHLDLSPEVGAMMSVKTPHTLLMAEWAHLLVENHGGPVDWLDVGLCATVKRFATCTDVRLVAGDVNLPTGPSVSSSVTQIAVTVGTAGQ
jgi:hypothetical protein